jgi:regulator of protease activity HflC (stomatin/prohibitin superfamily)
VFPVRKAVVGGACIIALAVVLLNAGSVVETNNAGEVCVKQAAITGDMSAVIKEGMFAQNWGAITHYKKQGTIYFDDESKCKDLLSRDRDAMCAMCIPVRFNDGAQACWKGSVRYELPLDEVTLIELHRGFRSFDSFIQSGVERRVQDVVFNTAALMSAEQSYTTHKNRFGEWSHDQLQNGNFVTLLREVLPSAMKIDADTKDAAAVAKENAAKDLGDAVHTTQQDDKKFVVEIEIRDGRPSRQENPLARYGVKIPQLVSRDIDYENNVKERIAAKQQALQAAIQSQALAEQARAAQIQAEAEGQRNVATAKYEAEVLKKKSVIEAEKNAQVATTNAQRDLDVQILAAKTAAQYKTQRNLESTADAEAQRRLLSSDNGFKVKVDAYIEIMKRWAEAFENRSGAVVPQISMGAAGGGGNATSDLMALLGVTVAQNLGLSLK